MEFDRSFRPFSVEMGILPIFSFFSKRDYMSQTSDLRMENSAVKLHIRV